MGGDGWSWSYRWASGGEEAEQPGSERFNRRLSWFRGTPEPERLRPGGSPNTRTDAAVVPV
jgi:hypothetical protein